MMLNDLVTLMRCCHDGQVLSSASIGGDEAKSLALMPNGGAVILAHENAVQVWALDWVLEHKVLPSPRVFSPALLVHVPASYFPRSRS